MDPETIKALAESGVSAVLIFIVVRQQLQIEKLLGSIIESERQHARNLIDIFCSGRVSMDASRPVGAFQADPGQSK